MARVRPATLIHIAVPLIAIVAPIAIIEYAAPRGIDSHLWVSAAIMIPVAFAIGSIYFKPRVSIRTSARRIEISSDGIGTMEASGGILQIEWEAVRSVEEVGGEYVVRAGNDLLLRIPRPSDTGTDAKLRKYLRKYLSDRALLARRNELSR